jgi:hypothetical protein
MKSIDFLIIVIFIIVLGSGGYMGYLLYTSNTNNQNDNVLDDNIDDFPVDECIDMDGDGYGEGCELGPDCDDNNPDLNISCEITLDSTLSLSLAEEKEKFEVGEQFEIIVAVEDLPSMKLDTLEFRLDFNGSVIKYLGHEVINSAYTGLELEPRDNSVRIDFAIPDGIQNMDQIMKLKFEALKDGLSDVRVSEDTRIGIEYMLKGGSVGIIVGTGVTSDITVQPDPLEEEIEMFDELVEQI